MKLAFIKPRIGDMIDRVYFDEARMEPLQLGILAAITPADVEIKLWDDRCEALPYDEPVDLVAITIETLTARRSYEIADTFRKRNVPVVMGGMHATLLPDEVKQHADAVVIGDAEPVWVTLLDDFLAGRLQQRYYGKTTTIQNNSLPQRSLYTGKGYLPISLLQFGRGCSNGCAFCAISAYFKQRNYCRDVSEVVREIRSQKLKRIFFVDDNIIANKTQAKALFQALIPLKIKWVSQASIDMVDDDELMTLMRQSGCLGNVIGFESIDAENLGGMNKGFNARYAENAYGQALATLRAYGFQTWAAFTLGHEHDTVESIAAITDFAIRNKFTFAAFNVLLPYPNTPLYDQLQNEGRLLYDGKWWLHEAYRFNHAAFHPNKMSADELTRAAFEARKRFNRWQSIFWRMLDRKTNMRNLERLAYYLLYNPLFRKETFKKQGMYLGSKR